MQLTVCVILIHVAPLSLLSLAMLASYIAPYHAEQKVETYFSTYVTIT